MFRIVLCCALALLALCPGEGYAADPPSFEDRLPLVERETCRETSPSFGNGPDGTFEAIVDMYASIFVDGNPAADAEVGVIVYLDGMPYLRAHTKSWGTQTQWVYHLKLPENWMQISEGMYYSALFALTPNLMAFEDERRSNPDIMQNENCTYEIFGTAPTAG